MTAPTVHTLIVSALFLHHVSSLSGFSEDAQRSRIHQQHESLIRSESPQKAAVMDARGTLQMKPHHHQQKVVPVVMKAYAFYHSTVDLQSEAKRLSEKCSGMLTLKTVKEGDVSIDVVTVRKQSATPVNKVFMLFGEHSRELISPESGLYFLRTLCGDVELSKASLLESGGAADVLDHSEFQIILNGNPRSRTKVEDGEYCLRVNPSGVDLNRNWDEHFESGDTSGPDTNPGPTPFSEPETKIFRDLVTAYAPTTFLTVHSGTRGMYMPWAYDMTHLANYNEPFMLDILKSMDSSHCQCPFGAAGKEVGYPCPGTCLDYAYGKLNTPFVFAFEIYAAASSDDDLRQRWQEKVKSGGVALLEKGHHLGHPHFRDLFSNHTSDFVGGKSINSKHHVQSKQGKQVGGDDFLDRASASDPSDDESQQECFAIFNPGTQPEYDEVVKNWAEAYLQMSTLVAAKVTKGEVPKRNGAMAVQ